MIKINLISKKSRAYKGRNWTRLISFILFGSFCLYFVGVSLYVVISISLIKGRITKVNKDSAEISGILLENNEKLSRFVLTKLILSKISEIDKSRFRYKDYLDQVSLLLPSGTQLTSVDFTSKGWIAVSVSSSDIGTFDALEKSLMNNNIWSGNNFFSGAYVESVMKEKSGSYSTKLQLELKKQNG